MDSLASKGGKFGFKGWAVWLQRVDSQASKGGPFGFKGWIVWLQRVDSLASKAPIAGTLKLGRSNIQLAIGVILMRSEMAMRK